MAMSDATITGGPATFVGLSGVYSAAVAYLTLLVAARTLSPEDNAIFLVYWALLFGAYGVVAGVSPEAARASYPAAQDRVGASLLGTALRFGVLVSAVLAASSLLWTPRVLPGHGFLALVVAAACLAYTGHLAVWGVVTGERRWPAVAGLLVAESTVRLVLVVLAFVVYDTLVALAVAAALPALTWVAGQVVPLLRRAARRRGDLAARGLLRNYAVASLASSASALVMVGFPVLIAATSTLAELAGAAGLILGISLTRAPLLVPLTALQGVALTYFLRARHRGWRALWVITASVLGVTLIGAVLAYLLGPWLFQALLGGSYTLDGRTLAALTASAGLLAILTLTGMFALALHRHGLFAAGWVAATVTAVLLLLAPLPLADRVLLSLLAGPLVGVAVHTVGLGGAPNRDRLEPSGRPQAVED